MTEPVRLREVTAGDLPLFFHHQLDPEANFQAAFVARDPGDRLAFDAHWRRIIADPEIVIRTVEVGEDVAGSIAAFRHEGVTEVTYWLGREFWGRGIATQALTLFIGELSVRPLIGRVAADHHASIRVLLKCGFEQVGTERGFANARGEEIAEVILVLNGPFTGNADTML